MDTNETMYRFRTGIWKNDLIIISFLALLSLYLLLALVYHQIKLKKQCKEKFFRLCLEERYRVLSKYTCIFIGIASILLHIISISLRAVEGKVFFSNTSTFQTVNFGTLCYTFSIIRNFAITAGSALIYLFLWFRQRIFYVHPSLKRLSNKYVRIFSIAVLILWVLFWIFLIFAFLMEVNYRFNAENGCLTEESSEMLNFLFIYVWTAASISMQIALLVLFVYPICKRSSWNSQPSSDRNFRLRKKVKKAVFLTSICLGTDLVTLLLVLLIYEENATRGIFAYNLNLVINHLAVIGCFDYWKELLWPWYKTHNATSPQTSQYDDEPTAGTFSQNRE